LAPEDPKFVEQKMTTDPNEICYRHGDQGRQKSAEDKYHGKVDQGHGGPDSTKTNKFKNSLSIQHSSIPQDAYAVLANPKFCNG
jgi:hypothetical protein